jgi:WD repeat-containing protein 48
LLTPLIPLIPLHPSMRDTPSILPSIPQSPAANHEATHIPSSHQRNRSGTIDGITTVGSTGSKEDYFSTRARQQGAPGSPDDFSGWTGPNKMDPQTPNTPSGLIGRLRNFGKTTKRPLSDTPNVSSPELVTPTIETPTQSEVCEACNLLAFFDANIAHKRCIRK